MFLATKDDLKICVTLSGQSVNITMVSMEDVIFFWQSWISREQKSAEAFLQAQPLKDNLYSLLKEYFKNRGWFVEENEYGKCG